ncbi:hypothetical protein [Vibrio halioticoli]|nr:hypothetical protein [Vibrio halioticoli]
MEIYVYADWVETNTPVLVGTLRSEVVRKKSILALRMMKNG